MRAWRRPKREPLDAEPARAPEHAGPEAPTVTGGPSDPSQVWIPEIVERIAASLSPNELACLRRVSVATAKLFPRHRELRLSQPSPRWAFEERWGALRCTRSLSRTQRRLVVTLTARSNDPGNLEVALAGTGLEPTHDNLCTAAAAGALATCRWLAEPGQLPEPVRWAAVLIAAAGAGQRAVCEWCLASRPGEEAHEGLDEAAREAAAAGHEGLMEWLVPLAEAEATLQGRELCVAAVSGCRLVTVKRLCAQYGSPQAWDGPAGFPFFITSALHGALTSAVDWQAKAEYLLVRGASVGSLDMYGYGGVATEVISEEPADVTERFLWLYAWGCPHPSHLPTPTRIATLGAALSSGNFWAVLSFLHSGMQLSSRELRPLVEDAAQKGHALVFEALIQAGQHVGWEGVSATGLAARAAYGGHADLLRQFLELGPLLPRPAYLTRAAEGGSVECMRILSERGCAPEAGAWSAAVTGGCEEAVELLAELGCPMPASGSPYLQALNKADWRMLPALRRAGVPFSAPGRENRLFLQAVEAGAPLPTLHWLLGEGCPVRSWAQALEAAEERTDRGSEAVVMWVEAQARRHAAGG